MSQINSPTLRKNILHNLMENSDYARQIGPFLKEEYFENRSERIVYEEIINHIKKYNKLPSAAAIKVQTESRDDLNEQDYNGINDFLNNKEVSVEQDIDWLVNTTEKWCKERAVVNAVYKAVAVIGGEDKKTEMTALPEMLHDAIATAFDKTVGHDFIGDAEARYEYYSKKENKVPTGFEHFDNILRGGIPNKTLGIAMAGTGVGKSLYMCSLSANLLAQGYNVLYISLEMQEEKIAQRIDQNLLNLTQEDIEKVNRDVFIKRIDALKKKTAGNLMIKEYATGSASSIHFKALLKELELKKGFKPDLICVDYLNICASARAGKNVNSYERVKFIAEELRGMAVENSVPIISATQTNRSGINSSEVTLENTSESIALPQTADYMFSLTSTDEMRVNGLIKVSQLKNRYGDPTNRLHWVMGVDYGKMRMYDLEEQPVQIDALNNEAQGKQKTKNLDDIDFQSDSGDTTDWKV